MSQFLAPLALHAGKQIITRFIKAVLIAMQRYLLGQRLRGSHNASKANSGQ